MGHSEFQRFNAYYGREDYAHHWVTSAFDGTRARFRNGDADFSMYGLDGRDQAVRKGTAYLSVFMYVIYELEDAFGDCERGCIQCNDSPVHAWDEGVCFYTGSIEGQDGAPAGKLLHQLADKRCANFKTCGVEGAEISGTSKLNYDIFSLFSVGNYQLLSGNCPALRATTDEIIKKMYVPMIQGTLRYAYKVGELMGPEKEKAEGAVFAAAVLPRIHAASPAAAKTIYDNMKVGARSTSFRDVKRAFESTYAAIGVTCADVGGYWNEGAGAYYPGMEPCADAVSSLEAAETKTEATAAIVLGTVFGGLFVLAVAMLFYMRSKEKQGAPVFQPTEDADTGTEEGTKDMD